ncbi:PREDICTED: reverse mRNAase [Prunus dulcis]|uniref:PREDICTED: reverse mRNAase n=1 Tax=Prunus dulcis TaxID=3755 RepID=A0A5E4FJ87_PRUDU|nr:hypothetical protein L3X38_004541 [Prunus dulcis]VVA28097.1 PREDICTED: reverse mRNAase [Prunus dulcis]
MILSIPLGNGDEGDRLIWPLNRNEIYSVKSGYNIMTDAPPSQYHDRPSSSRENCPELWKIIWKSNLIPKLKNFLWRIVRGCLSTKEGLFRRHLGASRLCPSCHDRCDAILESKCVCPNQSVVRIRQMLGAFHFASNPVTTLSMVPAPSNVTSENTWSHFPHGWCKFNVDASWDKVCMKSSLGGVIRDEDEIFLRGYECFRLLASMLEVEAHYALKGIYLAADLGATHIIIETDSKELVQNVNDGIGRSVWSIYPVISTVTRCCNQFNFYNWRWIPRRLNGIVDSIAANAWRRMSEEVQIHIPRLPWFLFCRWMDYLVLLDCRLLPVRG